MRMCSPKLLLSLPFFMVGVLSAQIKPTPAAERLSVIQQRKALAAQSILNQVPFRNVGPSIMSGRVVDLEVNPSDPTEFYVAYASGGLWHTINNGQSFVPIFDSTDIMTIGDIAINWKTRSIWVGTGEVNSSRSSYAGMGIYRSGNNGKTWDYLGLPESHHIGKIVLHPTNDQIAWVAALGHLYSPNKERGVYKTTDGGQQWRQVLYVDDNTGAVEMDINPQNPDELYAALWYKTRSAWNLVESGSTSGIYKSTNGGEQWQPITGAGSGFPNGDGVGRIGLAVFPQNPSIIYAIVDNNFRQPDTAKRNTDSSRYMLSDFKNLSKESFAALDNKKLQSFISSPRSGIPQKYTAAGLKEAVATDRFPPSVIWDYLYDANTALFETPIYGAQVYKSTDAGKTWNKTHEKAINLYSTYGYYFGKIFVSPVREDKVIITGVGILMSNDGGKTFKSIEGENVHSDHHAVWMSASKDGHLINGNDGGCNITYDDGKHWFKANTPAVGQFYAVAVDMARPYNVYGGLQDNGTWFGASTTRESFRWFDSGENPYKSINGGDGMQVQVDWRDNKTVYSGSQFGAYSRQTLGTPGRGTSVRPARDLGQPALRYNWQTPILLSRHQQDVFYYGSNQFHRSLNRGDSMVSMSSDLTTNPPQGDVPFGTLTTISESPIRFGLLYAGTDDGNIHVSRDGGYSWTLINKKLPKGLYVSRVVASGFQEGRVYATLNGYRNDHFAAYVYVSDDFGANWRSISANLPAEPVNVMREDPVQSNVLYVGTDGGLYVSIDGGNSYMMWNKGLPYSVPVHDLVIHPRDNELVLGTHGRSIYIAAVSEIRKLASDAAYREKREKEQRGQ